MDDPLNMRPGLPEHGIHGWSGLSMKNAIWRIDSMEEFETDFSGLGTKERAYRWYILPLSQYRFELGIAKSDAIVL